MELHSLHMQEIFLMEDTWPHKSILEMRKEFVFCEMGGMPRPLLRSNWAAALITSDQEKERLLNETFNFFHQAVRGAGRAQGRHEDHEPEVP